MERLLHYELTEQIGEGKNGPTYQALDTSTNRVVAVKLLTRESTKGDKWRVEFMSLMKALRDVSHEHIALFQGLEQASGQVFIIRDYIDGFSISDMVSGREVGSRDFMRTARGAAAALRAMHERQLLHRNICSSNLFVTARGRVVLADPGLNLPASDFVENPPAISEFTFLAPELFTGEEMTEQSDLYSLGVVLYHLLTGELPFQADDPQSLRWQILNATHEFRDPIAGLLPGDMRLMISRLLDREPSERFLSAEELHLTLQEMIRFRPAREATAVDRKKFHFSARQYLTVSMLILLLIIFWMVLSIYYR